jgi:hypothetical protein
VQLSDVQAGVETLDVDEKPRFFAHIYQRVAVFLMQKENEIQKLKQLVIFLTPLLLCAVITDFGYYQDPLRSVESNTQIHLNLSTDLEPPCQARSHGLLGTT